MMRSLNTAPLSHLPPRWSIHLSEPVVVGEGSIFYWLVPVQRARIGAKFLYFLIFIKELFDSFNMT